MMIKDSDSVTVPFSTTRRGPSRAASRPGFGFALIGVICVAGVFGLLGLLYTLG